MHQHSLEDQLAQHNKALHEIEGGRVGIHDIVGC